MPIWSRKPAKASSADALQPAQDGGDGDEDASAGRTADGASGDAVVGSAGAGDERVLEVRPESVACACWHILTRPFWMKYFESRTYHNTVIFLVALDLMTVVVDLGFTLAKCPTPELTEPTEKALEALTWTSIAILCVFIVEFGAQLLCFGLKWCKKVSNLLDVTVVVASLVLEIVLRASELREVVGLLIVFRLWRIVRVLHSTEEIIHIEHKQKLGATEAELKRLRRRLADAEAALAVLQAQQAM